MKQIEVRLVLEINVSAYSVRSFVVLIEVEEVDSPLTDVVYADQVSFPSGNLRGNAEGESLCKY